MPPTLRGGARVLLYKGPDAAAEIAEAAPETAKRQIRLRIIERYELPDALGTRTIVEMVSASGVRTQPEPGFAVTARAAEHR